MAVAVVLAAGLGTRMRSAKAKVLHPLLGKALVQHVVDAAGACEQIVVVVHHQSEAVRATVSGVDFVEQGEPNGTGHAVHRALAALPDTGTAVVMCGDAPLVPSTLIDELLSQHSSACTLVTTEVEDPGAYGRVTRENGRVTGIVEAAEASEGQLAIREVNAGLYAFDIAWLRQRLPLLQPHPPKGEIYLTDLVALAAQENNLQALLHPCALDLQGVNDRWALAEASSVLQRRILQQHALAGVTFEHPGSVVVEGAVRLAQDVCVGPGVVLRGDTQVHEGVHIEAHCVLTNAVVGPGAVVHAGSVVTDSTLAAGSSVGPMAHLRAHTTLGQGAAIGNFVEVKNTKVGPGSKAKHLAYLGDGQVGDAVNIGAGTIFCNYDGFDKHTTVVGDGAFVGSNSTLCAPVQVGGGAFVAAGSVITKDVAPDELAFGRARQSGKPHGAQRLRARKQKPESKNPL